MKKSGILALMLVFMIAFASLTACSRKEKAPETDAATESVETKADEKVIEFTDSKGRNIVINGEVDRVVALTASDCEIIYALGAGDKLVGRGEYCDWPAEVFDVPAVGSGGETNVEEIVALDPQVLIMATMTQTEEQVKALEEAGITVVVSEAYDIAATYDVINMIGKVVGKEAEAETLVKEMQDGFAALLTESADNTEKKTVFFEVSPLEYGLWTAGQGTFMQESADMLGLENIFADVQGWGEISEEQVIERNPDYIVTISMYGGEGPTPEEEISGRKGWENITAVKNQDILNIANNELSRPTPRLVKGVKALYEMVYGQ